jgi:hypothetical protein
MSEQWKPVPKYEHVHGVRDVWDHEVNVSDAPRVTDEIVERVGDNGEIAFGEVVCVITPDHASRGEASEGGSRSLIDHSNSLLLVRYEDNRIGIATRHEGTLRPGMMLEPYVAIHFGRVPNGSEAVIGERTVFGMAALSGVEGKAFGDGVSRVHGSIQIDERGMARIYDGREDVDPATRHVTDISSTNGTLVTVYEGNRWQQPDIISPLRHKEHLKKIFASPNIPDFKGETRESLITQESIENAATTLSLLGDTETRNILHRHCSGKAATLGEVVRLIRTDSELRVELGGRFLRLITEQKDLLPDRVQRRGEEKTPNHLGYKEKIKSTEYVALLMLSMLDGTFRSDISKKDEVEFINGRQETVIDKGQHRLAASNMIDELVPYEDRDKVPVFISIKRTYR